MTPDQLARGNAIEKEILALEEKLLVIEGTEEYHTRDERPLYVQVTDEMGRSAVRIDDNQIDGLGREVLNLMHKRVSAEIKSLKREFKAL